MPPSIRPFFKAPALPSKLGKANLKHVTEADDGKDENEPKLKQIFDNGLVGRNNLASIGWRKFYENSFEKNRYEND